MKIDTVPTFDPYKMTETQLKRCIFLLTRAIVRTYEPGNPHLAYVNNWRSDRIRMQRALDRKA